MSVSEVKRTTDESNRLQRVRRYWEQTRSELRKVVWPTREEATNLTVLVLAVTLAMSLLLGALDAVFSTLFQFLLR